MKAKIEAIRTALSAGLTIQIPLMEAGQILDFISPDYHEAAWDPLRSLGCEPRYQTGFIILCPVPQDQPFVGELGGREVPQ